MRAADPLFGPKDCTKLGHDDLPESDPLFDNDDGDTVRNGSTLKDQLPDGVNRLGDTSQQASEHPVPDTCPPDSISDAMIAYTLPEDTASLPLATALVAPSQQKPDESEEKDEERQRRSRHKAPRKQRGVVVQSDSDSDVNDGDNDLMVAIDLPTPVGINKASDMSSYEGVATSVAPDGLEYRLEELASKESALMKVLAQVEEQIKGIRSERARLLVSQNGIGSSEGSAVPTTFDPRNTPPQYDREYSSMRDGRGQQHQRSAPNVEQSANRPESDEGVRRHGSSGREYGEAIYSAAGPIVGNTASRSMDVGFTDPDAGYFNGNDVLDSNRTEAVAVKGTHQYASRPYDTQPPRQSYTPEQNRARDGVDDVDFLSPPKVSDPLHDRLGTCAKGTPLTIYTRMY